MPINPEKIIVRVGNELEGVDEEVRATLEGIAFVSSALLSVGYNEVLPKDSDHMSDIYYLLKTLDNGLAAAETFDSLSKEYPDLEERIVAIQEGLGSSAFLGYIWDLGCADAMYKLEPVDKNQPNDLTLTIIGLTEDSYNFFLE